MYIPKNSIFLICIILSCSSCWFYKDISRYKIEGYIYQKDKKPISNAQITFYSEDNNIPFIFLTKQDSTTSNDIGYYKFSERSHIVKGIIGGDRKMSPPLPHNFVIQKKGFISDTIDIRKYSAIKNTIKIDTIQLVPEN